MIKVYKESIYPSLGSKTTRRGGHSPLSIFFLHKVNVSTSSFDMTYNNLRNQLRLLSHIAQQWM